jgi:putative membrane protein
MTTGPDELPGAGIDRRLHPLSWLFVLLGHLRRYAVPIIALVVFGRSSGALLELVGVIGALGLTAHAAIQYRTCRFRLEGEELVIRSGLVQKSRRHIPFRRIHNVTLHQGLLHRLFGVAAVQIESAGGTGADTELEVLRLGDAQALESLLRRRAREVGAAGDEVAPESEPLLTLGGAEVLKLGLVSNRGLIALTAIVGAAWEIGRDRVEIPGLKDPVLRLSEQLALGPLSWLAAVVALLLVVAIVLQLLSVGLAFLQFHGFRLHAIDGRFQIERGLLSRVRASTPPGRIQAWSLRESAIHRLFARRSLRIDTAVSGDEDGERSLRELLPIAPREIIDAVVERIMPGAGWPDLPWQPLHPRAWRRMLVAPVLLTAVAAAVAARQMGPAGLAVLALLPWWLLRARLLARMAGWAVTERLVAVREGWLDRRWRVAEIDRLQALRLTRSPFDRRHGMATLWLDTAGAGSPARPLRLRYLPEGEARRLLDELGAVLAVTPLRW